MTNTTNLTVITNSAQNRFSIAIFNKVNVQTKNFPIVFPLPTFDVHSLPAVQSVPGFFFNISFYERYLFNDVRSENAIHTRNHFKSRKRCRA